MKSLLTTTIFICLVLLSRNISAAEIPRGEIVIISGGPAIRYQEDYRDPREQHDRFWGNFIRKARVRMEQLQHQYGRDTKITWLVYRPGYIKRADEEGRPLISFISSVRDKLGIKLIWFDRTDELISYINNHGFRNKIALLEYFGHSNRFCFLFDYSTNILGCSTDWLHERDLVKIKKSAFARGAIDRKSVV